jgi:hypothetical protein
MKKTMAIFGLVLALCSCKKDNNAGNYGNQPATPLPAELQGNWMFGNFSMTEYWSQDPYTYLGNGLEYAIAFKFYANGNYEQYFTSSSVSGGITTYQQSFTKGTAELDAAHQEIKTHPFTAHYKRTRNRQVLEERDLTGSELSGTTQYNYQLGKEPNGTPAIYLLLRGTNNPLTFLKK